MQEKTRAQGAVRNPRIEAASAWEQAAQRSFERALRKILQAVELELKGEVREAETVKESAREDVRDLELSLENYEAWACSER